MNLIEYVTNHIERGACQCGNCIDAPENPKDKQLKGHTVDLIFFKVRAVNNSDKEEFKRLVENEYPHWLDGKEHSYLETGGDMGDQGLALMTMGLGELLGIWELLTPESMMPFLDDNTKMKMAGTGFVNIIAKKENGNE
jgi:hypothetical protein